MVNLEPFLDYLRSEKRSSQHTVDAYRNDLEQFTTWCVREFDIHHPEEVTQQVVRSWMASLMDEAYAATSVHRKLSSVQAFCRFLMKTGVIRHNPARGIPKPKIPKRLPVFVDETGAKALYNKDIYQAKEDHHTPKEIFSAIRDQLIVTLLYETGIRQAELLGLKDKDIDEYIGQIKVTGKRNKMRYVPAGVELLDRIRQYQTERNRCFEQNPEGYLFINDTGKKISKTFVYLKVKNYLSQVSTIQRKSPHVLRHTFATHMLNNGADLNVIKEVLGHSSLAATQVYTHNSIEKLKGIHKKMHPRNN
ncbi:MAG: tyrosine-type recombinase/integrase [Flavobacteriales bacterium]|nr:tyrosine-type recombinase/integrase [Flavobacteriales bacterium]